MAAKPYCCLTPFASVQMLDPVPTNIAWMLGSLSLARGTALNTSRHITMAPDVVPEPPPNCTVIVVG
ncbi:unannotated protein [freshwater metagenome]|uniref:Unannotated protein n=1 Tax=freshwater metagenome TaxID=449393 RepID=A0A6J7R550_9ZZZZ